MNRIRDGDVRKLVYVFKRMAKEFISWMEKIEKGQEVDPTKKQ